LLLVFLVAGPLWSRFFLLLVSYGAV